MSSTDLRDLAKAMNALETITVKKKPTLGRQKYAFLVVLDFEATCWREKLRKAQNEIIEFAAVLLDVHNQQIVSVFKKYVKPTERPILSDFCTELTGISQSIVDNAETIETILKSFDDWIEENSKIYNFECHPLHQRSQLKCTFATWSDWDLGTCLKKECQRKRIRRMHYFFAWIDVRKTYMDFYKDQPMGLCGALESLKMEFVGQQHCGMDDARNTAFLINRMVEDGLTLINTRTLALE